MTDQEWLNNWEKDVIRSDTPLRDFMGFAALCGQYPTSAIRKHLSKKKIDRPAPNRRSWIIVLIIVIGFIVGLSLSHDADND
jgi:hypothetical protein